MAEKNSSRTKNGVFFLQLAARKIFGPSYFVTALMKSYIRIGKYSYPDIECPRRAWTNLRLFE